MRIFKNYIIIVLLLNTVLFSQQILQLNKGWNLVGAYVDIDPHIFKNSCVKSVWGYKESKWYIYIDSHEIYRFPSSAEYLRLIKRGSGFWIKASDKCKVKLSTISKEDLNSLNFPEKFYPYKSHPRLWLTQERLKILKKLKELNTPEWRNFKSLCDSIVNDDPSDDPYGIEISPQNFTAPLALQYLLTNDNRYADKALELMDKVTDDFSQYGDADHESFHYLALTYDWLYNYSGMTPERKIYYKNLMKKISDKFWNEYNINASGTDSDNNLLTGMMHLMFGAALYGDFNESIVMLDRGWSGWNRGYYLSRGISNRDIIKSALGGVYFTGMAYFPSTDIIGIAAYELTLMTAFGYDFNEIEKDLKPFWKNSIYAIIYLTLPNREKIEDYGSWQDSNALNTQPWLHRAVKILSYFADRSGYKYEASLIRGYEKENDIGYTDDNFLEFFFSDYNKSIISPYKEELPLIRFVKNPDFLFFKDGWGAKSVWGIFRGDGSIPMDQQSPDQGHFSLWYGDGYLTKAARNYESLLHGDFFNTLSIQNDCSYNGIDCSGTSIFDSKKTATIDKVLYGKQPLFAYCRLNADGQWNDNPEKYDAFEEINSYKRYLFWSGKYVVIFDRVTTKKPLNIRYRLRSLTKPHIDGDTVSQFGKSGNYKLIQKTLEPVDVKIKLLDESEEWRDIEDWVVDPSERRWQSVFDINATKNAKILNVIKMGDSSLNNFDEIYRIDDGKSCGTKVDNWLVILSCKESLRDRVDIKFKSSIKDLNFLIADLKEGEYDIKINGKIIFKKMVDLKSQALVFKTTLTDSNISLNIIGH